MNAKKVISGQWVVDRKEGGRRKAEGGSPTYDCRFPFPLCAVSRPTTNDQRPTIDLPLPPSPFPLRRRGFTLVELMVTITIIGILAAMSLAAMQRARAFAAEAKTKATIAKLDAIIMRRYESYATRRIPITIPPNTPPKVAAWMKLDALRDLMRMEMPDCAHDVLTPPYQFYWEASQLQANTRDTALHKMYARIPPWDSVGAADDFQNAQCLYLIVSSNPEDLEQFSQNEIGFVTDPNGRKHSVFVDGWGTPIMFLRWAPGFVPPAVDATLQTGNATTDHDPYDVRHVDNDAYRLVPFIYSAGPDKIMGIDIAHYFEPVPDPMNSSIRHLYTCYGSAKLVGQPVTIASDPVKAAGVHDNITNHQIEMK